MATYEDNKTPATGIIGTVLGGTALAFGAGLFNGGLGGLFGNNQNMAVQLSAKDSEIALLKAGAETDKKLVDVFTSLRAIDKSADEKISALSSRVLALETSAPLREQIVLGQVNSVAQALANNTATINATIASIQNCLNNITVCKVPNSAVCPGWGNATITPATSATTGNA